MRIETLLKNTNYHLPKNWTAMSQGELKENMLEHVENHCTEEEEKWFFEKMARYSDRQFGDMCARLSK